MDLTTAPRRIRRASLRRLVARRQNHHANLIITIKPELSMMSFSETIQRTGYIVAFLMNKMPITIGTERLLISYWTCLRQEWDVQAFLQTGAHEDESEGCNRGRKCSCDLSIVTLTIHWSRISFGTNNKGGELLNQLLLCDPQSFTNSHTDSLKSDMTLGTSFPCLQATSRSNGFSRHPSNLRNAAAMFCLVLSFTG
jgi:hypothetical protein